MLSEGGGDERYVIADYRSFRVKQAWIELVLARRLQGGFGALPPLGFFYFKKITSIGKIRTLLFVFNLLVTSNCGARPPVLDSVDFNVLRRSLFARGLLEVEFSFSYYLRGAREANIRSTRLLG